ncbi:hypothetical protein CsSME_00025339 [Camellia sinensis var. sinensis]
MFSLDIMVAIDKYNNELAESVMEKAKRLCREVHDFDVKVEMRVESGDPRDVICQATEKLGVDMVVLGSHCYGLIQRKKKQTGRRRRRREEGKKGKRRREEGKKQKQRQTAATEADGGLTIGGAAMIGRSAGMQGPFVCVCLHSLFSLLSLSFSLSSPLFSSPFSLSLSLSLFHLRFELENGENGRKKRKKKPNAQNDVVLDIRGLGGANFRTLKLYSFENLSLSIPIET